MTTAAEVYVVLEPDEFGSRKWVNRSEDVDLTSIEQAEQFAMDNDLIDVAIVKFIKFV